MANAADYETTAWQLLMRKITHAEPCSGAPDDLSLEISSQSDWTVAERISLHKQDQRRRGVFLNPQTLEHELFGKYAEAWAFQGVDIPLFDDIEQVQDRVEGMSPSTEVVLVASQKLLPCTHMVSADLIEHATNSIWEAYGNSDSDELNNVTDEMYEAAHTLAYETLKWWRLSSYEALYEEDTRISEVRTTVSCILAMLKLHEIPHA